jgi:hypothetical protein
VAEPRGAAAALALAAACRANGTFPAAACTAADVIAAGLVRDDPAALSRPVIEALARLAADLSTMVTSAPVDPLILAALPALVAGELERRAADAQ